MRTLVTALVLLAMAALTSFARAEVEKFSKIIPGYALNEYAIKGEPEQHLLNLNNEIEEKKALFPNHYPVISAAGRTDETGTIPENDRVGTRRAENAAGFLGDKQPKAKINVWSEGQKKNAREVWVQYWFEPIEPPSIIVQSVVPQEGSGSGWKVVLVAVISGTGLTAFLILRKRKQQPETRPVEVRECRREAHGKMYVFPIEKTGDFFRIPIFYVRDGKPVIKPTWPHVKTAINGFLKDPAYAEQISKFEQTNN